MSKANKTPAWCAQTLKKLDLSYNQPGNPDETAEGKRTDLKGAKRGMVEWCVPIEFGVDQVPDITYERDGLMF